MDVAAFLHLNALKWPRQARSTFTVAAIFEATIQFSLAERVHRLTTTRAADRAGVSDGTMYQYFPHKQALLYALNERFLDRLTECTEAVCMAHHGMTTPAMIKALINAYWDAKTERSNVMRVLYSSAVELAHEALITAFAERKDRVAKIMLATAPNANYAGLELVNCTPLSVIFGSVRNAFERSMPAMLQTEIRNQLVAMCQSHLRAAGG
jgi:AcrR family transcriptional regulator